MALYLPAVDLHSSNHLYCLANKTINQHSCADKNDA
jgi:hypothetical protein